MSTATIYATDNGGGCIESHSSTLSASHKTYQNARQGSLLSEYDDEGDPGPGGGTLTYRVGQWFDYTASPAEREWYCDEAAIVFDTSSLTGTVDSMTGSVYITSDDTTDQEFTLNWREYTGGWGARFTTDDWKGGATLLGLPLLGGLASSSFSASAYNDATLSGYDGTIIPDVYYVVLAASTHEIGTALGTATDTADKIGRITIQAAHYTGTSHDPKLTIVYGDNPSNVTITNPAFGSYDGTINLTGTASDPNGDTVRYHWEYSTNGGGSWTACANSPSGYVASGAAGTILFDTSVVAQGNVIDLRTRAFDSANYSFDYSSVKIARNAQQGVVIYRTGGDDLVAYGVSGCVMERPASAPSSLRFTLANFDAAEGSIADGDEVVLYIPYYSTGAIGSYMWRGWVRQKRSSHLCEFLCEDISYRFSMLRVTKTFSGDATLGTVIKTIVENPTGSHATGITATCQEVDDPVDPGYPLLVTDFDGKGRMLLEWLNEFANWSGCQWYVYYDTDLSAWQFIWYDPNANRTWGFACSDAIDFSAESTSAARIINQPVVTTDRTNYRNRVWFYTDASYTLDSVETAEVTANTEEPEEILIATQAMDATAAESLAQAYLDAYSKARVTIEDLVLYGIRDIDPDYDVSVTLTPNGITATAYPVQKITYALSEQGNTTTLALGDSSMNETLALQKLVRRISELQADVRY